MQSKNIETLKANLLSHLDVECNVINVQGALNAVNELIEHPTTQEELEQTRLGKYVNEFRKKTLHTELSKRAKDLLKKYQLIVNEAAGTKNFRKKEVPQGRNGIHVHSVAPAPLANGPQVLENGGQLNGKVKNSAHTPLVDKGREKLAHSSDLKSISTSSSAISQSNVNNLKNGVVPPSLESLERNVNNSQILSKRAAAVASPIPKDLSVIDVRSSPSTSNHHKVACDTVSPTGKKRRLDVPSANPNNAKRIKLENTPVNEPPAAKAKVPNGITPDAATEERVFTCKMSQKDLKFLFKSETISSAVSSPSRSIKNSSSSMTQDLAKSDIVNRIRKVPTTEQLLQKMQKSGELCSMPSHTIYNITNNRAVKDDASLTPSEAKPKSHKKRSKVQPPANTGDLTEVKNELLQKYLSSSESSNVRMYVPESPEMKAFVVDNIKREIPAVRTAPDVSKLDPNSEEYRRELLRNPDAFLPPLPEEEIICDHEKEPPRIFEPSADNVERLLDSRIPGVNGQYDSNNEWRSLNQTCIVRTHNDTYFPILPYVSLNLKN